MNIEIKQGDSCWNDAVMVRTKVFMEEQGYNDEFDDIDKISIHVVAYGDGAAAGCARVFPDAYESCRYVIGRVSVLPEYRNHGIGRMLVEACEKAARGEGATEMSLHAQARLEPWYSSMGYVSFGAVDYEDEGQPHVWMQKFFKK